VVCRTGEVVRLVRQGERVTGAELSGGEVLSAELVVLAAGAWSGRLVDLRGRASATGQVLAYISLTADEQSALESKPTILNMSTGMFIIPPRDRLLKVARHAYGYVNPVRIANPDREDEEIVVSLPRTQLDEPGQGIPREGEEACRKALREMIPSLEDRPFVKTRICWYTDTFVPSTVPHDPIHSTNILPVKTLRKLPDSLSSALRRPLPRDRRQRPRLQVSTRDRREDRRFHRGKHAGGVPR
jgi:sarcosine oxidase/L-pipecolate oxidase